MNTALAQLVQVLIDYKEGNITLKECDKKRDIIFNAYDGDTNILYKNAHERATAIVKQRKK